MFVAIEVMVRLRNILGESGVIDSEDALEKNAHSISEHEGRYVLAILKPTNQIQVIQIIQLFNEVKGDYSVYPISTGKNWGYGSKNPVIKNCFLLDLSKLNKIVYVDPKLGIAVIEPGVTQGQLIDAITDLPFKLNVTNSARESSIIGNALERGIGTSRHRSEDILGYEVVLGNGDTIKTGSLWPTTNDLHKAFHYPHGLGPNLMPPFNQSNFGVVTKAAISLIPKTEHFSIIKATFSARNLRDVYQHLKSLYDQNLINTYFKIYDISAALNYGLEKSVDDDYILYGSIETSDEFSLILKQFLLHKFEQSALFNLTEIMDEQYIADGKTTAAEKIIYETFKGQNNIHTYLENLFSVQSLEDIDTSGYDGWLFFVPIIPAEGKHLVRAVDLIESFRSQSDYRISLSIKCPKEKSIDLNISIRFPRDEHNSQKAHEMLNQLMSAFKKFGYLNYRYSIDHVANHQFFKEDSYNNSLTALKNTFDPRNIIAPGRYIEI
jgi:4-cresol dehydrogenase (hydroxylating)